MAKDEKLDDQLLPPFHLAQAYPDASSIFAISIPSLEDTKDDALIVLDTNVLLIPYTINPKSLDDIRKTYARLINESRLFIPAQVAREFARNRAKKIAELFQQFSRKRNKLEGLQSGRYPLFDPLPEYNQLLKVEKEIDEKLRQHRDLITSILNHIRSWRWNDSVSTLYRELFAPSIIIDCSLTQKDIETDLERRNVNRVPPGFKDASKDDQGVGDLIIWHTILQLGAQRKKDIIFVSGEEKSDWWHRSEGEPLYPRFELVDEYKRISDNRAFHIAKFSQLLDLFGAEEQVVDEIRKEEIATRTIPSSPSEYLQFVSLAEDAVFAWLQSRFVEEARIVRSPRIKFPDFILEFTSGKRVGVDVKSFRSSHPALVMQRIREYMYRGYYEVNEGQLDVFVLVLVIQGEEAARETVKRIQRATNNVTKVSLIVGTVDSLGCFIPILENLSEIYD